MEKSLATSHLNDTAWLEQLTGARVEVLRKVRLASKVFARRWSSFFEWVSQPHIRNRILIGAGGVLAFALIFFGIPALGFTAGGIQAGSWASGFQAATYAGATPAGGWFAGLTSVAMTGQVPLLASTGAVLTMANGWVIAQHLELKNHLRKIKRE
ncbi:hypothetical protein BDV93DRAFT_545432 [Ceratobasidium sp. AG-I]|nr:hypothetical protein BDV93DRAFT_545432 [Ceratobasidium sp. AG-I]